MTDSGSHFYDVYECADGKWLAVGPIESKFYAQLLQLLEIDPSQLGPQLDPASWPASKALLAERFKTRTRDDWAARFADSDACVAPVLDWAEAPEHPHLKARGTFLEIDGVLQPAPAPRFSRTKPTTPTPPNEIDSKHTAATLRSWLGDARVAGLRRDGVID